ncbi:MAG: YicC/YloC family endoribonuclease [Thermodesulfobacteriota bacterium]
MAAKSMTGYGRGEAKAGGRIWTIELRCVNNRFLDLKMKLPKGYAELEDMIRKKVSLHHQRGRVDLFCSITGVRTDAVQMRVNLPMARAYREGLSQVAGELGLDDRVDLQQLSTLPDVLVREEQSEDMETIRPLVEKALEEALHRCNDMRGREGGALVTDLQQRLKTFSQTVNTIEEGLPELLRQRKIGLEERLTKLLDNIQLEPQRLAQEVALLADKTDVTEELVRLHSHIKQFSDFLAEDGPVGKKLDFLLQEFLREVNTMASKINDAQIAHLTVGLKGELEKMREQVQNIE